MKTVKELLQWAEDYAEGKDKEPSAIKILMMHYTKKESYELIADMNMQLTEEVINDYKNGVKEYVDNNVPVQHIIGYEYFYGHNFIVNDQVLIPRFETEELVANVLSAYDDYFNGKEVDVVDVGTGSGAIAITLALEEPNFTVDATDISETALAVANQNNQNLGANVNFIQGDMLKPLIEKGKKYDILVSNPPYIPREQFVESLVKDNEPHVALFGGGDGLYFYRLILQDAHKIVRDKAIIAFEHGWDQAEEIKKLAMQYFPQGDIEQIKDINNKDRMTFVKI